MARVAVLHNTLDFNGGADAVCLHVCEALQAAHDVTLFTISETSLSALNELFGTDAAVTVETLPGTGPLARLLARVDDWRGPQLAFRSVLLDRWFRRRAAAFDLAVSTANEFALPVPSVQYVHFPQFNGHVAGPDGVHGGGVADRVWTRMAGLDDRRLPADATLLANSTYTADHVVARYGRGASVVHPPVDPIPGEPWADRERGVVTVGRIAPDNRTLDAIRAVDGVRERGYDLHLHLVGSAAEAYRSYVDRVEAAVAAREHVTLERSVPRTRLEALLGSHRYGLNPKRGEHFGMALAEYVAAGMVPFAHDSGGQRDVVDGAEDRLFGTVTEATERLVAAIEADARPRLPPDRFAVDRFHERIRTAVDDRLAGR
ncbi:glycosyltransferase family 4 protein [Haloarcula pelagica]|uniref:glycosyltransferase family 4 protein n=1 Tax=Haloarcula pelagica TaxID=3033389 RepID=UPI0024C2C8AA|nr:glycosyltransferase family 4 protein [Halomicroarcula sp. YJ-61-S]